MKKQLLLLLTTFFITNIYSQISFEKGYFINNNNQKTDCLIKNLDWRNNPTNFDYKLSENSESLNTDIKQVKEFGINNTSKYIRETVKIDKSSATVDNLSKEKEPLFMEETLFLEVLIEGDATLYYYENDDLKRFFFKKTTSNLEQLVYKSYLNTDNKIEINNHFKQQLWINLTCPAIEINTIQTLDYRKNSLVPFFINYNKCSNANFINYDENVKKDLINLAFRLHLNTTSLAIQDSPNNIIDVDFGNKVALSFGIEAEFIFPFHKNKWSIIIEPTYQNFKSEKRNKPDNGANLDLTATIDYRSIEIPVGLRHYFFLNTNSKIFVNASYIVDLSTKSSIEYKKNDTSTFNLYNIKTNNNFGMGLGYKFKDKYSLEMRYQTSRQLVLEDVPNTTNYNKLSLIVGYSIF